MTALEYPDEVHDEPPDGWQPDLVRVNTALRAINRRLSSALEETVAYLHAEGLHEHADWLDSKVGF